ncbi:MAG: NUDIX domain-containing protein [Pseudomonas sp.]|uniref:NUDIX domain-containing protein n=1 Tax=Pseudomonas sp. TaxID=306 RepID=UPI003D12560B
MEFPRKRIAVGALIRDEQGRLLLVKPAYRDGWLIPGGVVDADESPRDGLLRELREELGLTRPIDTLLCVDYMVAGAAYGEGLHLLFDGGCLNSIQAQALVICDAELVALHWATAAEAQALLVPSLARRLQSLEEAPLGTLLYLENGLPLTP